MELPQIVRTYIDTFCRQDLDECLATFPRAVEFMTTLPKTESGKIQRYLLRAQHAQHQE